MTTETPEVLTADLSQIKPFSKFESDLAKMKAENDSLVFDLSTPKGIKESRSHIFSIRKARAALEKARKEAKQSALDYGRMIDSEAKRIEAELDSMISVHEAPLLEMEAKEAARIDAIKARIAVLEGYKLIHGQMSSAVWREQLTILESFVIDASLAEFMAPAAIAKDAGIAFAKDQMAQAEKREAEAAELERLRELERQRLQQEREAKIAQEAAERATREAEAKAAREKAEQERKAKQEQEAAVEAQRKREQAAADELRKSQEAAAKAERDRVAAEQRAKDAEEAARRKLAQEQEDERRAAEKREKDKKHRAAINNAALRALVEAGLSDADARLAVEAIAKGQVPNVRIEY